uniref:FHA domain-containing protein n=1 Tax=Caenorhabditis japonica TaxID=281687 RepID=A0A8R1E1M0_CAEJA
MARGTKRRLESEQKQKIVNVNRDDTQPVDESVFTDSQSTNFTKPFGRLVGIRRGISNIDLVEGQFVCGRGSDDAPINYTFSTMCNDNGLYRFISKIQFSIVRDFESKKSVLHDHSRNGTLVNQDMVGKGNFKELQNGDLISIGIPSLIVFVYEDVDDRQYPDDLTRKYHVTSHSLGKGGFGNVLLGYKKSDRSVVRIFPK